MLITGIAYGQHNSAVNLSEIMFYPAPGSSEFIELYNCSFTDTVDLSGYQIIYHTSKSDEILPVSNTTLLPPQSYAVIFEGDYDFENGAYKDIIPGDAVLLKLDDNAFGSSGMSNSSDRNIWLVDAAGDTVNDYLYSANNQPGYSDEKIIPCGDDLVANWGNSKTSMGTPGRKNSLTPKDYDLAATDIIISPTFPVKGDQVSITLKIKNLGKNAENFSVFLFEDSNLDSLPDIQVDSIGNLNLAQNDSGFIHFNFKISGINKRMGYLASVEYPEDEDTGNNKIYKIISPGYNRGSVLINEIMFLPAGDEPEWIELYNNSGDTVNLTGWSLGDVLTRPDFETIEDTLIIPPKSFAVLSDDSTVSLYHRFIPAPVISASWPNLNNDEDGVVLYDERGATIDSVFYIGSIIDEKGYSLERVSIENSSTDLTNWRKSEDIENSTPGRANSISPKKYDLTISEILFTPQFPVPGDDVSVTVIVKNNGLQSGSQFETIIKFGDKNVSTFKNAPLPHDSVEVFFKDAVKNLSKAISLSAEIISDEDEDTLNNYAAAHLIPGEKRNTVLINEIMYDPGKDNTEWVELVNCSNRKINLKNWMIGEILPDTCRVIISDDDLYIEQGELFVIAKSSGFLSMFPDLKNNSRVINFGSLGNIEDGIIIYDFRGATIDSVFYHSAWGGGDGISLERISLKESSCDSANWISSLSQTFSTPGNVNSILSIPSYNYNDLVINEIMYEPGPDNSEFIEFLNTSGSEINIGGMKLYDDNGMIGMISTVNHFIGPGEFCLAAADSNLLRFYELDNCFTNFNFRGNFSLSNDKETLILKDINGKTIDSISYSSEWHNKNYLSTKNISLEKINPLLSGNYSQNWSSSANIAGATPGKKNSIFTAVNNSSSGLEIMPNPFSPDNDGFEDFTVVNYHLKQAVSQISIKIFDSRGRLVRTLASNLPGGSEGKVIFDGKDDDNNPLRIGIYVLFFEALNENYGIVESFKKAFVIARKLN